MCSGDFGGGWWRGEVIGKLRDHMDSFAANFLVWDGRGDKELPRRFGC
jgi:hypothetical protein